VFGVWTFNEWSLSEDILKLSDKQNCSKVTPRFLQLVALLLSAALSGTFRPNSTAGSLVVAIF